MDLLFENFHILLGIGIAISVWLKNRGAAKEEEESERQAREEMVRQLQEMDHGQVQKPTPPPVPKNWDTQPRPTTPPEVKPPALKELFKEMVEQLDPVPGMLQQSQTRESAYDDEPAPWEDFKHEDASHDEIGADSHPEPNPVLDRQRKMQERLAELKKKAAEYKGKAAGARETQQRASGKSRAAIADLPPIAEVLKDRSQTRRAIILNEILSKPIALR